VQRPRGHDQLERQERGGDPKDGGLQELVGHGTTNIWSGRAAIGTGCLAGISDA
jgi:hypothetical protein